MTLSRREAQDTDSLTTPTTALSAFPAFRRLSETRPRLAPRDATIPAFLDWIRHDIGWAGEHLQADLWCEYVDVCRVKGYRPIKWKKFGRELAAAGFKPYQLDNRHGGKGARPMAIDLSEQKPVEAEIVSKLAAISGPNRIAATKGKSLPIGAKPQKRMNLPWREAA